MSSVQLNTAIVDAIASAFNNNIENIIRQLAEKHDFDPTEAIAEFVGNVTIDKKSVEKKSVEKKSPDKKLSVPEFALPWTNQPITHCCDALRSYYGIFSQCTNAKHGSSLFCKTCSKKGDQQPCGTVRDRSVDDFTAPNGKKPLHYTVFMKKVDITEQQVRDEASKFNITLNDDTFSTPSVGRGRPKKSVTIVEDSDDNTKKSAGRPKKVVNTEPSVDDLIHNLDSPTPSLSQSLTIQIPDDMVATKQHIPVSPNDDD